MELEFDLGVSVNEQTEQELESGGKLPAGWYRATIHDIFQDSEEPAMKLEFRVSHGPYKGKTIKDTLWDPRAEEDTDAAKTKQNRLLLVSKRIGARDDNSSAINFRKAIDREVALHCQQQQEAVCDGCATKKPKGSKLRKCSTCGGKYEWKDVVGGFVNITWDGVFPLDHDKLTDEVRKQLGITVPRRGESGGTAAATTLSPAPAAPTAPAERRAGARPTPIPAGVPAAPSAPAMSQQERLAAATADL